MSTTIKCPHCNSGNVAKSMKGGLGKVNSGSPITLGMGRSTGLSGTLGNQAPVEYICYDCDCLFNEVFTQDGEIQETTIKKAPVPDEIIEQVRNGLTEPLKKERPYVSAVIFTLLTLYCLICFFIGVSEDSGIQIFLAFLFGIPMLIPAILKWKKIARLNNEIEELETPSPREFKKAHKDLFRQYSQYN